MKFDVLRAIGHNLADSLGSGIGLLVGIYQCDVYGEAKARNDKEITVDFLKGEALGQAVSSTLAGAIARYRSGLADLCAKHGISPEAFAELTARYSVDRIGPRVDVIVADHFGHRAEDHYIGIPARRVKALDRLGRVRTI